MANEPTKRGRRPVHPGEIIREDILPGFGMNIGQFADAIGVSRKTLSMLINERQGISVGMAVKLSKAFGNSPRFWSNLQTSFELWHVEPLDWKNP